MNKIQIKSIIKKGNTIEIVFSNSAELEKYFIDKVFRSEYSEDISATPDSLAILPFVCNVLPIVWITGAELEVEEIDSDFMTGYKDILKGYREMFPGIKFVGTLSANKIVENSRSLMTSGNSAAFFSGGVDAFATLIAHIDEKPTLITLWGSDIDLDDTDGWEIVRNHVAHTARDFELGYVFVKTNFRTFINYKSLNQLVSKSDDSWWHGFQHGIGLIGHAAPIVWKNNLSSLYIAASFTEKSRGKLTCASDPTIDNHVKMAGCHTVHDQYEYERIQKVNHIVEFINQTNIPLDLRVCYVSRGGRNCCHCEKCLRTMYEIFAFGEDPRRYGFNYSEKDLLDSKKIVLLNYNFINKPLWEEIQTEFINNPNLRLTKEIEWIRTTDIEKERSTPEFKLYALGHFLHKLPQRIVRKIKYLKDKL